jgi:FkbM family methyltransferase
MRDGPLKDLDAKPSMVLRSLQFAVRRRLLKRKYSWVVSLMPSFLWGGESVPVDTQVGPMWLSTRDRSASSLLLLGSLSHEERESRLVRSLAKSCKVIFDVGARYGWYPLLATLSNPSVTVFAFEANVQAFAHLSANAAFKSIRCFNMELGDGDGVGTLNSGTQGGPQPSLHRLAALPPLYFGTIDTFIHERQISDVDLVRCDVEGREAEVVAGAAHLTRSHTPPIWLIKASEGFLREVSRESQDSRAAIVSLMSGGKPSGELFFQDQDYRPVRIRSVGERMCGINMFYVPPERRCQFDAAAEKIDRS